MYVGDGTAFITKSKEVHPSYRSRPSLRHPGTRREVPAAARTYLVDGRSPAGTEEEPTFQPELIEASPASFHAPLVGSATAEAVRLAEMTEPAAAVVPDPDETGPESGGVIEARIEALQQQVEELNERLLALEAAQVPPEQDLTPVGVRPYILSDGQREAAVGPITFYRAGLR